MQQHLRLWMNEPHSAKHSFNLKSNSTPESPAQTLFMLLWFWLRNFIRITRMHSWSPSVTNRQDDSRQCNFCVILIQNRHDISNGTGINQKPNEPTTNRNKICITVKLKKLKKIQDISVNVSTSPGFHWNYIIANSWKSGLRKTWFGYLIGLHFLEWVNVT